MIYYVAAEEIQEGSELHVWYTTSYEQKLQEELKALGYVQNTGVSHISAHSAIPRLPQASVQSISPLHIAPSLSKISVGRGQVTFTHRCESYGSIVKAPTVSEGFLVTDKYFSADGVQGSQSHSVYSCNYIHGTSITEKRDQGLSSHSLKYIAATNQSNILQSIELVNDIDNLNEFECIVTLKLTAVPDAEGMELNSFPDEHYDEYDMSENDKSAENMPKQSSSNNDEKEPSAAHKKKSVRLRERKIGMYIKLFFIITLFLEECVVLNIWEHINEN